MQDLHLPEFLQASCEYCTSSRVPELEGGRKEGKEIFFNLRGVLRKLPEVGN
jgi:hypothetical protein